MTVVTRFAPSPTGFLHIGGARTALFNWLFAKHHNGKFLLRIEDTDRKRSSKEAVEAIYHGLKWMGLDWDGDAISQFERAPRHVEVANQLLAEGKAYKCYCSPEELTEMRELAKKEKRRVGYDGRWRDKDPSEAPEGVDPVIRFKAPTEGKTVIKDQVQGEVTVANDQLDDMILLRADGTPTYMLAVVVDDYDMGVTHAIRGDDHLNNAFRQIQLYLAMGWEPPVYAHIPLIHGQDGAKLSKRHGALGVEAYEEMGFLPEAMRNYLVRLGWGHGDDEIFSTEQAIEWFSLEGIGKAASRFDTAKLTAVNGNYIKEAENNRLVSLILQRLSTNSGINISEQAEERLKQGMQGLKERAKTLIELAENSLFYAVDVPLEYTPKALKLLDAEGRDKISSLLAKFKKIEGWNTEALEVIVKAYAEENELKLGKVAQPLRAALSGTTVTPGIFEVMEVLGREESLKRIAAAVQLTDA
ncbi:MAG: glutamate--tRNA ligase [Alphaproteobacteria bacterium]|nr:glutamate--tRNA ligase [Rhodospirillales bacterium]MCW9045731.1 glutamate--tRNA ligase [Alphaproteobacteria bacterium]